jgi:hypothetical protein
MLTEKETEIMQALENIQALIGAQFGKPRDLPRCEKCTYWRHESGGIGACTHPCHNHKSQGPRMFCEMTIYAIQTTGNFGCQNHSDYS